MSGKRGAPKGRRPVLYVCSAIIDGKLVQESISVQDQDPESPSGEFPVKIAISYFEKKYGQEPEIVSQPLFEKKSVKKSTSNRKKLVIDRENIDNYVLSSEHQRGRCGSWNGMINRCVNDENKAFFVPISHTDASKKTNPPAAGIVDINDIIIYQDDDSNNLENTTNEVSY